MSEPAATSDLEWLVSEAARPWLDLAAEAGAPTPQFVDRLRRELTADRARLVTQQAGLRKKAQAKFELAGRMFFNPVALEQATDQWLARYKAGRFPSDGLLADLCCGIGGDLLSLASRGQAIGVDKDQGTAIFAEANTAVWQAAGRGDGAKIRCQDVASLDVASLAAWHIDPDRRPQGRRTTLAELHEPSPAVIDNLLSQNGRAAIKLAPAGELPSHWGEQAELEWISRRRECRQLVAWFGDLAAHPGQRTATVLDGAGRAQRTVVGEPGVAIAVAAAVGQFVFEPDPAALAAGLTGVLVGEHGLEAVAPGVAYLTGDASISDPALSQFRVLEVLPFDQRKINHWLAERNVGELEIKKRGVTLDPAALRKQLRLRGDRAAVLLIAKIAGRQTAIFAER